MQFKLKNKNNITLHTKNKICREDISIGIDDIEKEKIIPENIAEGQSILGVIGTFRGGIDTSDATAESKDILLGVTAYNATGKIEGSIPYYEYNSDMFEKPEIDLLLTNELTTYTNRRITETRMWAFSGCNKLTELNLPNCEVFSPYTMQGTSITKARFPKLKRIGQNAIYQNSKLQVLILDSVEILDAGAIRGSTILTKLVIKTPDQICSVLSSNTFAECYHLLGVVHATHNPDGLKDGLIYVPDDLVESVYDDQGNLIKQGYKDATNWSKFAEQIRPLSEWDGE